MDKEKISAEIKHRTIAVVGLGLMGGSLSLVLKAKQKGIRIIGVENNALHAQQAMALQLADEILPLPEAIANSSLIILAIPVDVTVALLPGILDLLTHQTVIDMGSTKKNIIDAIASHVKRGRFVATHPMWGTEFSGPKAAVNDAFTGKAVVICDKEKSDDDALAVVENLYADLGMHPVYMNSTDHDLHTAYISHISHITSFALANTVLEREKEENTIFELASAGFESTVRLAKSNPAMWVPIFKQNRENVLDVLNEHISQLRKFKSCLEKENYEYLHQLIENANGIQKILK